MSESAQRDYISSVATITPVEERERLASQKENGVLSDAGFAAQQAKTLSR